MRRRRTVLALGGAVLLAIIAATGYALGTTRGGRPAIGGLDVYVTRATTAPRDVRVYATAIAEVHGRRPQLAAGAQGPPATPLISFDGIGHARVAFYLARCSPAECPDAPSDARAEDPERAFAVNGRPVPGTPGPWLWYVGMCRGRTRIHITVTGAERFRVDVSPSTATTSDDGDHC